MSVGRSLLVGIALLAACHPEHVAPEPEADPDPAARVGVGVVLFADDFESGAIDPAWILQSSAQGRIEVGVGGTPGSAWHLTMDDAVGDGTYSLNEAILPLDIEEPAVSGDEVILSFWARNTADESHPDDAVSVSDDGITWHTVLALGPVLTSSFTRYEVDLVDAALTYSLDPGGMYVRFSQYDNYPMNTDGIGIDDVLVEARPPLLPMFYDDFATGISSFWWTQSSTEDGRIVVESDASASGGAKVVMDDAVAGGAYSLNELVLSPWSQGEYEHLRLVFTAADTNDEAHAQDAISIADGAGVWHEVFDLGAISGTPTKYAVELDDVIAAHNLDTTTLQIRFAQYDNYPSPTDGLVLYDVLVEGCFVTAEATGVLVSAEDAIERYDLEGALIDTIPVPDPPTGGDYLRGLAKDQLGNLWVYNGTFTPSLSVTADEVSWDHTDLAGWSTANNTTYGGLDIIGSWVFVTDTATAGAGAPEGIIRFDAYTGAGTRFSDTTSYRDLAIGQDGLLYALPDSYWADVEVYEPNTMTSYGTIPVADPDPRGVEGDIFGNVYVSLHGGDIVHLDAWGTELDRLDVGIGTLNDIALSEDGRIAVSHAAYGATVALTDFTLGSVERVFSVGDPQDFVKPFVAFEEVWP